MKRLLLSLCLIGAVFPGHIRLALQTAHGPPTSVEQPIEARAVFALPETAVLGSMPQSPDSGVEHTAVQSLAMVGPDIQAIPSRSGDKQQALLPTPGSGLPYCFEGPCLPRLRWDIAKPVLKPLAALSKAFV